jgi:K+-sensing histidine kinase KdpD
MTHNNEANPELLKELEQLKQTDEETEHLKISWLVSFSYEIRTPINGIFVFSEL